MPEHEIDLPLHKGKPPLTLNQRIHWAEKNRHTRCIRESVGWQAKTLALNLGVREHITVSCHYATGDRRRRDTDNLVPSFKPAIDGLVDAGLIVDDDPQHVTLVMPTIHNGTGKRRLWITIHITEES